MTVRPTNVLPRVRDWLNFTLTNRIPRHALTRLMARVGRLEHPLVRGASIALWRLLCDVDLDDAETTRFRSLHDAFTRRLRPGARPVDPDPAVLASPCDGIVGACGRIEHGQLLQAKGRPYTLAELLLDPALEDAHRDGTYVTLRLTAGMYHRFHAPHACRVTGVTWVPGDAYNVNPPAVARIDRLYCRNERAVVRTRSEATGAPVTLVPVAAVLVASIRLHCVDVLLHLDWRGPRELPCDVRVAKGEELGWFEHGSTIIVLAPAGHALAAGIGTGVVVRAGQALLRAQ